MAFDAHKNLAITTVATAPAPATSGTTLTVAVGEGARFPVAPFNCTVWPVSALPTPVNAEVLRVTARTGDVLTITRAQEGTTARSIIAGDFIAETITAKALTDIESGTNFPLITTAGAGSFGGAVTATVNQNAGVQLMTLQNMNAGAASFASFTLVAGANTANGLYAFADGYTSAGANQANGTALYASWAGGLSLAATAALGAIRLYTGGPVERGRIHPSGGFSWGCAADPGAGFFGVSTTGFAAGQSSLLLTPESGMLFRTAATSGYPSTFFTSAGQAGFIQCTGTTTAYSTASDARLKTPLGRHTDPDVLRRTVIHDFVWKSDGRPGRGVFAQEAHQVAPFAVSVGTDDRDENGNLKQPWGVDYSKYVPDLIAGWQDHDEKIDQLLGAVETNVALMERLTALETATITPASPQHPWKAIRTAIRLMIAWVFMRGSSWVG